MTQSKKMEQNVVGGTMSPGRKSFLEYLKHRQAKCRPVEADSLEKKANLLEHKFVIGESIQGAVSSLVVPHAIIGGHAVSFHGNPRMTDDIDILVHASNLSQAVAQLKLQNVSPLRIGGYSGVDPNGFRIDLVAPNQPWVEPAINQTVPTPYGPMINAPFLVISKLWDSRGSQDETDILGILKNMSSDELDTTRLLVKTYLPNDIEDLESLIVMRNY